MVRPHHSLRRAATAIAAFLAIASSVRAEENVVLVRMLHEGQNYRVRAGAAALIGQLRDTEHRPDLEGALKDQHPQVREAAANALGEICSPSSLGPLNGVATHDRVASVAQSARAAIHTIEVHTPSPEPERSEHARFGLLLGAMHNQSAFTAPELTTALAQAIARDFAELPDVRVFLPEQAQQALDAKAHGLALYRIEGTLVSMIAELLEREVSVHCEVSLLVLDHPSGAMRTLLRGSARGVEVSDENAPAAQQLAIAQRVVSAAVRSALHEAEGAIARGTP